MTTHLRRRVLEDVVGARVTQLEVATMPIAIIGTAGGSLGSLFSYDLSYAKDSDGVYVSISSGTEPYAGFLGVLDPTLLENGIYHVRLMATDINGTSTSTTINVQVSGRAKIGLFTLTFTDLTIPVSGIPITVTRTYGSRVKVKRDFGVGWTLGVAAGSYERNRKPGDGWGFSALGNTFVNGIGTGCDVITETKKHAVTVRLSDHEFYTFNLQFGTAFPLSGGCGASVEFEQVDGISPGATLTVLGNNGVFAPGGSDQVLDDETGNVFDPQQVELVTPDGRTVDFDKTNGVFAVADLNGNSISISSSGIVSSTGKGISFARDAQGRITTITDPMGYTLQYSYSEAGDLATFTDQEQNRTTFDYDSQHNLTEIHDPLGNRAIKSDYDSSGRLISTTDALGHTTNIAHDLTGHTETVTDRLGHPTVFQYDTDGNVTLKIDALGGRTAMIYDSRGNVLATTDALGRVSRSTYDAMNNVISTTNFDGDTTVFTRNSLGQVLTSSDARGRVIRNTYDASGNLLSTIDGTGATTHFTYDPSGNRLTMTDPLGHLTSYAYDSNGNQTSVTDPLGHVTTNTFDANNRRTSTSRNRTLPSGTTETITTQYSHNAVGKPTMTTDADGNTTTVNYDAIQKPSSVVAKNGSATAYARDALHRVTAITYVDGTSDYYVHDANGNTQIETNRGGEVTTYTYDALNRRTRKIHSDGSYIETTYDAIGRVLTVRDENGNVTTHVYATHRETITDALGHSTVNVMDSDGSVVTRMDALGRLTRYTYDLGSDGEGRGRLVRVDLPGGAFTTTGYDAEGRKTSDTDADGNTTIFGYDPVGRLIAVTDPLSHATAYGHDEVGNRVLVTDANGHTTRFEFDRLGRKTKRTLPLGEFETFGYDVMGNQVSHVDFNGQTTTYVFDNQNRMTSRAYPGIPAQSFTYGPRGERLTAGPEAFTYDARLRMLSNTKGDGTVIGYTYDAVGNRTSIMDPHGTTRYTFDGLNRIATVTDPEMGVYVYSYDQVGNMTGTSLPNGVTTTRGYDQLNHLTSILSVGAHNAVLASYLYSPDPVGRQQGAVEQHLNRSVLWGYDAAGRLTSENITDPVNGSKAVTYLYDPVGNRSSRVDSTSGTTNYSYDPDDHLLTEAGPPGTTTYSYDLNGNVTQKAGSSVTTTFGYDARNLQSSVTSGASSYTYEYDVDGARTATILNGARTNILVDRNRSNAQVLREVDGTGAEIAHQIFGRGEILSSTEGRQGQRYMLYDAQRSVRQLTTGTASVSDQYTFDAFGNPISTSAHTDNNYRYGGEQTDNETALIYLRARRYNPSTGRFQNLDPHAGSIPEEATSNPYIYADDNPVTKDDPSGNWTQIIITYDDILWGGVTYGSHAAIRVDRAEGGRTAALFDPAGTYVPEGDVISPSDYILLDDQADLDKYLAYHEKTGSTWQVFSYNTSQAEEELLYYWFKNIRDPGVRISGGQCAYACSEVLNKVDRFADLGTFFLPNSLGKGLIAHKSFNFSIQPIHSEAPDVSTVNTGGVGP